MSSSCYFCILLLTSFFHFCLSTQNFNHVLCKDVERRALLQFKRGLIDHANQLASWVDEEKECCSWAGIVCDNFTGHVHQIRLRGVDGHCHHHDNTTDHIDEEVSKQVSLAGDLGPLRPLVYVTPTYSEGVEVEVSEQSLGGDLSPSLLHLKQLRHLDLSCNDFGGIQVPSFIGSLRNLKHLNLSYSRFGGIIPPQLGNLSELQVLGLGSFYDRSYELTRLLNMQWLSSLHMLHHLDMSGMNLSQAIDWFQVINTLPSLIQLHLSSCQLSHMHPHVSSLNITSLSLLDLSGNLFDGIPMPRWILGIPSLVSLDLSRCGIQGLHDSFRNLTSLKLLDVSGNNFMSSSSVLKGLSGSNLISLDLSACDVSSSQLVALHNLTSLLSLDLSDNQLTKPIPKSLGNLCNLREIDLSRNKFHNVSLAYLLESFFECKSPCLESLIIPSSELSGHLPIQLGQLIHLVNLDLSSNTLNGSLPASLCQLSILYRLDLSNNQLTGGLPLSLGHLSKLNSLHLEHNQLNGSLPPSLGQLLKLDQLDLSDNLLTGGLPLSLGQLSKLNSLHLEFNQLTGGLPPSLSQLLKLDQLDLSNNQLTGGLPPSLGQLSKLSSLHLQNNQLTGGLPLSLGQLSKLNSLHLENNQLNGVLPHSLGQLSKLISLNLENNQLNGVLPHSLGQLSNLDLLLLSNNKLNGSLPHSLGQLSKLKTLDISSNLLTGVVTEAHFVNLTKLRYLYGKGNNLIFRPQLANWIPPFQLERLNLNSWNLGPQFPMWLQSQRHLMQLDISNTSISAPFPHLFWRSFPNLYLLDMSQNHIQGTLSGVPATLEALILSSNNFTGRLPDISNSSMLNDLDLSYNFFAGSLHGFLCPNEEKFIQLLNVGNNRLTGVVPECWVKWPYLESLNLENNNLSGEVPRTLGFSSQLFSLNMRGNMLSGRLPASLKNLTGLVLLQLGRNELVGSIPTWLGTELQLLKSLELRSNNFDGNIPQELCYLTKIHILDLAHNNLSGNIPRCFDNFSVLSGKEPNKKLSYELSSIRDKPYLVSESLVTKGREDIYNTILALVMMIDLSSNNFVGHIPNELTALRELKSLNLSRNQLTGKIPEKIGDMKSLESFDLSLNKLSGELPTSLSSLSFLSNFNVSYNSLAGRIPSSTQLQSFDESSFFGNNLCGDPLTKPCVVAVPYRDEEEKDGSHGADWGLIISMVLGIVVGFWMIVGPLIVSRSWRIAYFGLLMRVWYMAYDVVHKYCCN